MGFFQILILVPLLPWLVILMRLKRFRSVAAAASSAFIASGGIMLWFLVLAAAGLFDTLERFDHDLIAPMAYAGIGMMIGAAACTFFDNRS